MSERDVSDAPNSAAVEHFRSVRRTKPLVSGGKVRFGGGAAHRQLRPLQR
jgi:hypothetical protein